MTDSLINVRINFNNNNKILIIVVKEQIKLICIEYCLEI